MWIDLDLFMSFGFSVFLKEYILNLVDLLPRAPLYAARTNSGDSSLLSNLISSGLCFNILLHRRIFHECFTFMKCLPIQCSFLSHQSLYQTAYLFLLAWIGRLTLRTDLKNSYVISYIHKYFPACNLLY